MSRIGLFLERSTWGEVTLETAQGVGMGGRETALVSLASEWAKKGHDVYAFVPMRSDTSYTTYFKRGTVTHVPNQYTIEVAEALRLDMFVSWENAEIFTQIRGDVGKRIIEMQVAHLNTLKPLEEYPIDAIAVLSRWAKRFFIHCHQGFDSDKIFVLENGIDPERFRHIRKSPSSRETIDFIYSSSPDRGLHHLLEMWPDIKSSVEKDFAKQASLHVCYGIENFIQNSRWSHREDGLRALSIEQNINNEGVNYHGKIGQKELAQLMVGCDAMLYPCDTMSPTETGCISIVEALAARIPVITTDCDCIGEDYKDYVSIVNLPVNSENYIRSIIYTIGNITKSQIDRAYRFATRDRSWTSIAQRWEKVFLR